jgi:CYTH domain-containing protein
MINLEVERKYRIFFMSEYLLDKIEEYDHTSQDITQHYLEIEDDYEIRIRRIVSKDGVKYTMTRKDKTDGPAREESYAIELTESLYKHLKMVSKGSINKERFTIPLENELELELDMYYEQYTGLVVGEIEFNNEEDYQNFDQSLLDPYSDGMILDVSDRDDFKNSYLATHEPTIIKAD